MSKKIQNGKFVERTVAEETELQRLKTARYGVESNLKPRRSKEAFAKITSSQFEKIMCIRANPSAMAMFIVLAYQNFKHWDKPFQLEVNSFAEQGFSPATQRRALVRLEKVGLISVTRQPRKKPPIIRVL